MWKSLSGSLLDCDLWRACDRQIRIRAHEYHPYICDSGNCFVAIHYQVTPQIDADDMVLSSGGSWWVDVEFSTEC